MLLSRKFFTVSGMTVLSRILGVFREAALSHFLGACSEMDAFLIAYKFPNFFRKCFAEGGFQSIFIPYFTDFVATNKFKGARYFSSRILSLIFWGMLCFSIFVIIFAKEFVMIMAPGFANDPEKMSLSIEFTRIIFPSVGFIALSTVYGSILISHGKFFLFSLAPVLINIILILSLFVCTDLLTAGRRLSYGILCSGIFQYVYLYFGARFSKLTTPTLTNIRITPRIKSFLSKLIPVLAGAGVAQVNVFMGSLFGSFLPTGCISYIYFADRFIQLPLALFGISMGIVLVPEIAKSIAKKENENLQEVQNKAIVFTMRLTIPSVVGLISLSYLLISSLYGHGRFSETSVQKTADVLKVFAIGLPGYVAAKIISSVLFAQKDSRTPVNATIMSIIVNVILSAILLMPFQEIGIAIATSVSGFVNVYALCRKSKGWFVGNREIFFDLLKIIWSSAIMLIVIIFIQKLIPISYSNITHEILLTCFCSIIGFIAYISSLFFLKDAATRDFIAKLISYTQPEST